MDPVLQVLNSRTFCQKNGITHTTSAPYHPSSNGLAERAVQIVKQGIKKLQEGSLKDKVSRTLFTYRTTPHTTTGQTQCYSYTS